MLGTSSAVLPTFDASAAHPVLEIARQALREYDRARLVAFFDGLPDQNARSFAYRHLGDFAAKGTDRFLAQSAEVETGACVARLLYARRLISIGWNIRGAARAKFVSREQFAGFHRQLASAEQVLYRVLLEDPSNASAWTASLFTALGLQMGQDEARRRYEQAVKADPHHFRAQVAYLQQLAPKWGGSWEALHRSAHEWMLEAPVGAPNAVAVVDAHLEHWLGLGRGLKALRYLRQTRVREEIYHAAERSVLHPDFDRQYEWVSVRSAFAMIFSLLRDQRAAAVQFRALGRYASKHPWQYLDNERFLHYRAKALAAAG